MLKQHRFVKPSQSLKSKTGSSDSVKKNKFRNHFSSLRCGMCYGALQEARNLQCFHAFCTPCLEQRLNNLPPGDRSLQCPLCLLTTPVSERGLLDLPENLYILAHDASSLSKSHCQLCDGFDSLAVSKCVDCDDLMCADCKNVHQKQKLFKRHNVISICDKQNSISTSIARGSHCEIHPEEIIESFCRSCHQLACQHCITLNHQDHAIVNLLENSTASKETISKLVEGIRAYLPYVKSNMNRAEKEIESLKTNATESRQKIIDHAERLKEAIDAMCAETLAEIDELLVKHMRLMEDFKKDMERVYLSVRTLAESTDQMLQYAPDVQIIKLKDVLANRLESIPKEIPHCSLISAKFEFSPGKLPTLDIFGKTSVSPLPILEFSPYDRNVPTFFCPGRPYTICPVLSGDEAWVICDTPETIHLYSESGAIRRILKMPGEVNDICCLPDGCLLVTELRGIAIWKVDSNDTITTFTTIHEAVRGICCNGNKVYVTKRDRDSQGVAILDHSDSSVYSEITKHGGNDIFMHPDRLSVAPDGTTICVTDRGSQGAVIFTSEDGRTIATYKGEGDGRHTERFEPWGLCIDQQDNIFVSDRYNDTIHLLTSTGEFVKYVLARDDGIRRPLGVAVDRKCRLWIGNEDGSIKVFDYTDLIT